VIVVRPNDPNYIAGIYYITLITEVRARVHTGVPMRTHVKIFGILNYPHLARFSRGFSDSIDLI